MAQVGDIRENPETGEPQAYVGDPPEWTSFSPEGAGQVPFAGQRRYNRGAWQVFKEAGTEKDEEGRSFPVFRWQSVNLVAPELLPVLAHYDGVDYREDKKTGDISIFYHPKNAPPSSWISLDEIDAQAKQREQAKEEGPFLEEFGDAPPGYVGDWPPRTQSGAINRNAAFQAIAKTQRDQVQAIEDRRRQEFSQANIETDNARAQAEFEFRKSQALKPSWDDIILNALENGQEDKAIYFNEFKNRPTRIQALNFAMQYAQTPEEFNALISLAQGPAREYGQRAWDAYAAARIQTNPFPAGSQEARAFDAGTPSQQQQYNLRQQYLKASGGHLPGEQLGTIQTIPTKGPFSVQPPQTFQDVANEAGTAQAYQRTQGPFNAITEAEKASALADEAGAKPRGPFTYAPGSEGGLLAASPELRGAKGYFDFLKTIPAGTPTSRSASPLMFTTDAALNQGLQEARTPEARNVFQTEIDRRTANGAGQSFSDFMAGGPNIGGPLTTQEAANLAAGNPYAGKVLSTDENGQWTQWVDTQTGERFAEQPGGGIKSTGVFTPLPKAQTPLTPSLDVPDSIFARRRTPRQVFAPPVVVQRR